MLLCGFHKAFDSVPRPFLLQNVAETQDLRELHQYNQRYIESYTEGCKLHIGVTDEWVSSKEILWVQCYSVCLYMYAGTA